jgi:type I restriction enzyme, S subunit
MTNPNTQTTDLPAGWVWTPVETIAELFRGISYNKDEASKESKVDYKPILRANNINGSLNFEDLVYVPEKRIEDFQYIRAGDIIFAMSSGSKHLVGKAAIAQQDFNGSYGAFCALLRGTNLINKLYLAYFFQTNHYRKLISRISKGTKLKSN